MNDRHATRAHLVPDLPSLIDRPRPFASRRPFKLIVAACAVLATAAALLAPRTLTSLALASAPRAASTVKEVLSRSIAARGGLAKLHAVTTRRETGLLGLGAGNEWPLTVEHKRPNRMRMEIDLQGAKLIRGFDGTAGWQKQPQAPAPEALTGDDLHNIANEADFDGSLVDTAAKGKAVLVGKESIGGAAGHDTYKVQVTLRGGDQFYFYIDAATYLPAHWEGTRLINGKPVVFESDFSDYREVGGVKYAFQILSSIKGSAQKQKIAFSKIEVNTPIDDARFSIASIPAPPAPPAAGTGPAPPPAAGAPPPPPAARPARA